MIVIDLSAEVAALESSPSVQSAGAARERLQIAIVELALARRTLLEIDPLTALDLDVALVRLVCGSGGRA